MYQRRSWDVLPSFVHHGGAPAQQESGDHHEHADPERQRELGPDPKGGDAGDIGPCRNIPESLYFFEWNTGRAAMISQKATNPLGIIAPVSRKYPG